MNKFDKIEYNVILLFNVKMVGLLMYASIMIDQVTKRENHIFLIHDYGNKLKGFKFFRNVNMKMFEY
jgi:hypothetical protein